MHQSIQRVSFDQKRDTRPVSGASLAGLYFFSLIATFATILLMQDWLVQSSLVVVSRASLLTCLITIVAGYQLSGRNIWTYSFVYLFILGLFHFGLTGPYALGLISSEDLSYAHAWWLLPVTPSALVVIMKGYVACGIGIGIGRIFEQPRRKSSEVPNQEDSGPPIVLLAGSILVTTSVVYWFFSVYSSGGFAAFTASYGSYLVATSGYLMPWVSMGLGMGVSFLAISPPSALRTWSVAAFVIFACVALPMGLRGEVLFAAAAAVPIVAKHRRMPSARVAFVGFLVVMFGISLIQDVRQVGLGRAGEGDFDAGITTGLVELGGTIRPVILTVSWHEDGESFLMGASYWGPFDRAFCRVIDPGSCIPSSEDARLSNVTIMQRAGPYGFSPIAEAYRNFGNYGFIVLGGIGLLVAFLNTWAVSWKSQAYASVVFVELLINVRNAFTAVPAHLAFGAAIVLTMVVAAKYIRKRPSYSQPVIASGRSTSRETNSVNTGSAWQRKM